MNAKLNQYSKITYYSIPLLRLTNSHVFTLNDIVTQLKRNLFDYTIQGKAPQYIVFYKLNKGI